MIDSVEEKKGDDHISPLLTYVKSFLEVNDAFKQQINPSITEVKQIMEQQAPKMELKSHYFNSKVILKSLNCELLTTTIQNLEKELADQVHRN